MTPLYTTFLVSLIFTQQSIADTLKGRVTRILDGDTIEVIDAANTPFRIRLMGIDAPEKKQAFGNKSKEFLSSLVYDKQVAVEFNKKDRYGRIVGKITVSGVDANLEQIKSGMAWHYKKYQKEQPEDDRSKYARSEDEARERKRGLWIVPKPIPPWDWRKRN